MLVPYFDEFFIRKMTNFGDRLVYLTAGRQNLYTSRNYPHCDVPCPNLHSSLPVNDLSALSFFNQYPFRASYALPVGEPSDVDRAVLNGRDPSLELPKMKRLWHMSTKRALYSLKNKHLPDLTEKTIRVHRSMAKVLNVVKNDPDEYFDASYNSYYTGGNLSCDVVVEGKKYFTYPSASDDRNLDLQPLIVGIDKIYDSENCHRTTVRLKKAEKSPIFQLTAYNDVLQSRQRNTCVLLQLQDHDDHHLQGNVMHVVKHKRAFYSCCYDPNSKTSYYLSADWVISARDVESEKDVTFTNLSGKGDMWGCIRCHEQNTLLFSNRSGVHLLDLRENPKYYGGRDWEIKGVTDECEEIFFFSESRENNLYVVTSHQLFALDMRKGWNQRWTHGIAEGPGLLSVTPQESGNESIFIGSLFVDDLVQVENYWNDSKSFRIGSIPPYSLPSLTETLHKAHNLGLCLSPIVHPRFRMSSTGLCSYDDGENVHVLRRTSAGDVFHQRLFKKSTRGGNTVDLSKDDVHHLELWEKSCDALFVTRMPKVPLCDKAPGEQLEKVFTTVKKRCQSAQLSTSSVKDDSAKVAAKKPHWKYSKEQLADCKDWLASKIVNVWKIDDDEWSSDGSHEPDDEADERVLELELDDSDHEEDNRIERIINWIQGFPVESAACGMDGAIREDIARFTDQAPKLDAKQATSLSDEAASTSSTVAETTAPDKQDPVVETVNPQVPVDETRDRNEQAVKRKFVAGF